MKKIYKSDTNKVISGVIGGVGEYYNTDPVLLRLAYLLILVVTGVFPGLIAYLVATLIVPEHPRASHMPTEKPKEPVHEHTPTEQKVAEDTPEIK
jgi:phage shock protein C